MLHSLFGSTERDFVAADTAKGLPEQDLLFQLPLWYFLESIREMSAEEKKAVKCPPQKLKCHNLVRLQKQLKV